MKAYYLLVAVAASIAAVAVASGLQETQPRTQETKAEAETEAWFIGA